MPVISIPILCDRFHVVSIGHIIFHKNSGIYLKQCDICVTVLIIEIHSRIPKMAISIGSVGLKIKIGVECGCH